MRIALVFWGLTRSLNKTYPNIKNKIFDHLKNNKIEYKIFLHTYYFKGLLNDKRTGEKNVKLNFDEYKLLQPDYYKIDNQDEIKKQININKYLKFKYAYINKTSENLICALYSQLQATLLLEQSTEKFDYIWYIRPDVIFKDIFPLRWLKWVNSNRFIVPLFAGCKGINDRMAVLNTDQALIYGKRFYQIEKYGNLIKGKQKFSSERFLKWVTNKYKVKRVNYLFKRLRSNGNFNEKDDKLFLKN